VDQDETREQSHRQMVREFHERFSVALDRTEFHPWAFGKLLEHRRELIREEYRELVDEIYVLPKDVNFERITKEACDLIYVLVGMLEAFGINSDEAFRLVHESNMSKLGPDGEPIYRDDGKVVKGPNYRPPDLSGVVPRIKKE